MKDNDGRTHLLSLSLEFYKTVPTTGPLTSFFWSCDEFVCGDDSLNSVLGHLVCVFLSIC